MNAEQMIIEDIFTKVYPPSSDLYIESSVKISTDEGEFLLHLKRQEGQDWSLEGVYVHSIFDFKNKVIKKEADEWFEIFLKTKKVMLDVLAHAVRARFIQLMEEELNKF